MKMMRPQFFVLHPRQIRAAQADAAQDVHFKEADPVSIRNLFKRLGFKDAKVVDENVHGGKIIHELFYNRRVCKITGKAAELGVGQRLANLRKCAVNRFFGAAVDDDVDALARETGGDGQADAFGGTGNQGDFISKLKIHNATKFASRAAMSTFRQFHKILQQLQADLLAFLRVKLRGENIVAPDGRRKGAAVIRARRDDGLASTGCGKKLWTK